MLPGRQTPLYWEALKQAFLRARELAESERRDVVEEFGARYPEACAELEAMLDADDRTATEDETDPLPGAILGGRYCVDSPMGQGGFGRIYLAHDLKLNDRQVVVKVAGGSFWEADSTDSGSDDTRKYAIEFLKNEKGALARLDHPHIVPILDAGETPEGRPFLVLPRIEGPTLRQLLGVTGKLDRRRAARLLGDVARALDAAHQAGLFHLDVKPSNIVIRDAGQDSESAVLIDFGQARAIRQLKKQPAATPAYAAPEAIVGEGVVASDIFALARVAAEVLLGRRLRGQERPWWLPGAIREALHPDPARRPPTARSIAEAVAPDSYAWLAGTALAALFVFAIWMGSSRANHPAPTTMHSTPLLATTDPGWEDRPVLSADGQTLFYTGGPLEAKQELHRKDLQTKLVQGLSTPGTNVQSPTLSPDGKICAWIEQRGGPSRSVVVVLDLSTGARKEFLAGRHIEVIAWAGPRGGLYATEVLPDSRQWTLIHISITDGTRRIVAEAPAGALGFNDVGVSPNGRLLVAKLQRRPYDADLYLFDVKPDGSLGPTRQFTYLGGRTDHPRFRPDGKGIVFMSGPLGNRTLFEADLADGTKIRPLDGAPSRVTEYAIASNGDLAVALDMTDSNIYRVPLFPPNRGTARALAPATFNDDEVSISPHGKVVAFESERSGAPQLWSVSATGGDLRQLTNWPNTNSVAAVWGSHPNELFVSIRFQDGESKVRKLNLETLQSEDLLAGAMATSATQSGDLVLGELQSRRDNTWLYRTGDHSIQTVSPRAAGGKAILSADERTLWYSVRNPADGVTELDLRTGSEGRLAPSLYRRTLFDVRGTNLYWIALGEGKGNRPVLTLFRRKIPNGPIEKLHEFDRDVFWGLSIAPDESAAYVSLCDVANSDIRILKGFFR